MVKPRNDRDRPFDGVEPPNHTQIPNTLLDDLMRIMECSELKVTLAICRQTFGWHKKEDELSLSQLRELTGLSRQSVIAGIEAGMRRGVIRRRPKGQSYVYRIQLVQPLDQLGTAGAVETPKPAPLVQPLDQTSLTIRPVDVSTSPTIRPELVQPLDTQKKGKKDLYIPPPPQPDRTQAGGGGGARTSEMIDPLVALFARYDITQAEPLARLYHAQWPDVTIETLTRLCEHLAEPDAGGYAGARLYRKLKAGPYERQQQPQRPPASPGRRSAAGPAARDPRVVAYEAEQLAAFAARADRGVSDV